MTHASLQACVLRKQRPHKPGQKLVLFAYQPSLFIWTLYFILDCLQTLEHLYLICTAHLAEDADMLVSYTVVTAVAVVAAVGKGLHMRIQAPQPSHYLAVFRSEIWQNLGCGSLPLLLLSQSAMEVSKHYPFSVLLEDTTIISGSI